MRLEDHIGSIGIDLGTKGLILPKRDSIERMKKAEDKSAKLGKEVTPRECMGQTSCMCKEGFLCKRI